MTPPYRASPMAVDDYLNKLNDDPFALFDFLSSNVSLSSKLSETTIQQSRSTEKVSNILEELRSLAFSQSLLCNIQRVEYREQVEVTLKKLDNYIRDLSESQSKGLNKFNDFYNKVVTICKDKSLNEEKVFDTGKRSAREKERLRLKEESDELAESLVLKNILEIFRRGKNKTFRLIWIAIELQYEELDLSCEFQK